MRSEARFAEHSFGKLISKLCPVEQDFSLPMRLRIGKEAIYLRVVRTLERRISHKRPLGPGPLIRLQHRPE